MFNMVEHKQQSSGEQLKPENHPVQMQLHMLLTQSAHDVLVFSSGPKCYFGADSVVSSFILLPEIRSDSGRNEAQVRRR